MNVIPSAPAFRLAAYGALLVAVLGGGAAVGAAFGPEPADDPPAAHGEHGAEPSDADAEPTPGLAATQDGYHLALETPVVTAGSPAELALVIHDPAGDVLTDYDVAHEQELHLVIVGRDLRSYAHVHPVRDEQGTWRVTAPTLPAGPYRLYADFVPAGGRGLTLGTELAVAGTYEPQPLPLPHAATTVDSYEVTFEGELVAGHRSELAVTVRRDGRAVTDLDPYLGALGHLVAIRDGDMAYLHVHPLDDPDSPGGPTVRFEVDVPTPGTYGLFFDFSHRDQVRTAAVVLTATGAGTRAAEDTEHGHGD